MKAINFDSLFEIDADDAVACLEKLNPSLRADFVERAFSTLFANGSDTKVQSRSILIVQTLLANGRGTFVPKDCLLRLTETIEFTKATDDRRTRKQAILLANLLAQRLGNSLRDLPEESQDALDELDQVQALASNVKRLKTTLENAKTFSKVSGIHDRTFELPNLDLNQAKENVVRDSEQDWYVDPWAWPELKNLSDRDVAERLAKTELGWTFPLDVHKSSEGTRPAIVMAPIDRVAYQCLADELSLVATRELPEWVFGWRVKRMNSKKGDYESNADEWKKFKKRILDHSEKFTYVIRLDVRSFFESVDTEVLLSSIGRFYKKTNTLHRLSRYFEQLNSRKNGTGLPQRSLASSILAHVPLASADAFLSLKRNESGDDKVEPLRWMDDFWLFGNSEANLRSVAAEVEAALRHNGLGINPRKTVFEECNVALSKMLLDISGIVADGEDVAKKLLRIVDDSAEAPRRSDINFLLNFRGGLTGEIEKEILQSLPALSLEKLNHAADRIADFIRDKQDWKNHSVWYQELVKRQADQHSWSIAAWGRMFPDEIGKSEEANEIKDFFSERFVSHIQQSLLPLAANRLASWTPSSAKNLFTEFLAQSDASDSFFSVRAIALALQQSGWAKRDILGELKNTNEDYGAAISKIL